MNLRRNPPSTLSIMLNIEAILDQKPVRSGEGALDYEQVLGRSRQNRPIFGYRFGAGPRHVSLIGGCHADEPVGPAMLDRLVSYLATLPSDDSLLTEWSWWLVPHTNPDGEQRNQSWTQILGDADSWSQKETPVEVDLWTYWNHVVRERPGDDMEFGFPRSDQDAEARPENRAVASFLESGAPFHLHGSFHGMGFAAGPWFLIEYDWAERCLAMRRALAEEVERGGYALHDIDRKGDKGFHRIDVGFTSRPDSRSMIRHFEDLGDLDTAALFRPSSMEWVRAQGGDPLTLVSEMPLFLLPGEVYKVGDPIRPPALGRLREALTQGPEALAAASRSIGLRPMPFRDQMFFQLHFLDQALKTVDAEMS